LIHSMYNKPMKCRFVFYRRSHFHLPVVNEIQSRNGGVRKSNDLKSAALFFFLIHTFHGPIIHKKYTNVNPKHKKSSRSFALNSYRRNKQ